jgi:hypothetical protein
MIPMTSNQSTIFETKRLHIRPAEEADVGLFFQLWTNPQLMVHVGYPGGLPITLKKW